MLFLIPGNVCQIIFFLWCCAEKVLKELMRSTDCRIKDVRQFVSDIKPDLKYNIAPITDVYGPAGTDDAIECIVVSRETIRGAEAVNKIRAERGKNFLICFLFSLMISEYVVNYLCCYCVSTGCWIQIAVHTAVASSSRFTTDCSLLLQIVFASGLAEDIIVSTVKAMSLCHH